MIPVFQLLGLFDGNDMTETGPIVAAAEATLELPAVSAGGAIDPALPNGAPVFRRELDPSDLEPYAVGFTAHVGAAEIDSIDTITMSFAGMAVGVTVEGETPRWPIIDASGRKRVQIWLSVAEEFRSHAAFNGAGLKVGISFFVQLSDGRRVERTVIVIVRQQ